MPADTERLITIPPFRLEPRVRLARWRERLVTVQAKDEEELRLGRLFVVLMVVGTGIALALSVIFLLTQPLGLLGPKVSWTAAAFPLAFVALALYCLVRARQGHIRSSVHLYVWANFAAISVAVFLFDGVSSPGWVLYAWNVTIAGSLLAPASSLRLTGGVLAYYVVLLVATHFGVYSPLLSFGRGREFVHIALVLVILASTVGLLTWLSMRSLQEATGKLRESESRFRGVFEHAGDVIFTLAQDQTFTSLNPAFEATTEWKAGDWLARSFAPIIHPDDLPHAFDLFEQLMQHEISEHFELRIRKRSGGYFTGEFTVARIAHGEEVAVLGICRDVTARKLMEERIQKLNEELEEKVRKRTAELVKAQEILVRQEKLAVIGRIGGIVGHEIRNPLGVISNAVYYLEAVLSGADETVMDYLGIIGHEVRVAERIAADLLDFARTKPPQKTSVSVADVVRENRQRLQLPANVTIVEDFPAGSPPVFVDPVQVGQVFANLMKNAVEAMPQGGTLTIAARPGGAGLLQVSFADTGTGISEENRQNLFQPLFTTKPRGLGLGLTIVKNLTEANGGKVEVESESRKGTTFSISLPLVPGI